MAKNEVTAITVDGEIYVRQAETVPANSNIKIVILQRGWVMIGRWSQNGEMCALDDASTIRVWGTTKGLGELALGGKTSKTVLDRCGRVDFHILTTVAVLNCAEDKWRASL